MLILKSIPILRYRIQEPGKRWPEGEEPASEAKKSRVMKTFGLDEEAYAEARRQFQKVCQDLQISGKAGTNVSKWDDAKNTFVAQNTTIRDILFLDGTTDEAENREGVLDAFCRHAALGTKRVSTGSGQGQAEVGAEAREKQGDDGELMEVEEASIQASIGDMVKEEEEDDEFMEVDRMTRDDVHREATADAANSLEILRMIVAQDLNMHE